ncbi:protein FAM177B [Aulostomus maculatus]
MNDRHQEETEFGCPVQSKQKKIIHFSSGETLTEDDSEEEEEEEEEQQSSNSVPFRDPAPRARFSFKNVAALLGRLSLLTCDFIGERLACALGLTAAKYQYAIDQHQRDQQTTSSQTTNSLKGRQGESAHLSLGVEGSLYGAMGQRRCPADRPQPCDETQPSRDEGRVNRSYQADEDYQR